MDHFEKLKRQVQLRVLAGVACFSFVATGLVWLLPHVLGFSWLLTLCTVATLVLLLAVWISALIADSTLAPLRLVQQAVLHIDPDRHQVAAPNLEKLAIGRELVTALTQQIYEFASQQNGTDLIAHRRELSQAANVVERMPLPLFVFNRQLLVTSASKAALEYCQINSAELFGKPLFDSLRLEFGSENTLEAWITECQDNRVTDTAYWQRVHVFSKEGNLIRQCDIAARYNRESPSGTEFIVTMFDRTTEYNQDDESLSFVALAVHELRTPITMMRGYIEVFEEELADQLDEEMTSFMAKMDASAKRLSSYVNNILDVARIDQNQLTLHLTEENWQDVLKSGAADMDIRAKINNKTIHFDIANNLPTVAVDRLSMSEVLNNLLENAIKYGGKSTDITVRSALNKDGLVETTVQDYGVGIPTSVLPSLFEKFSRNHRTRSEVKGTGLGLYLCKALIAAHGGQIWASSKEGEGSTFGFTILPYSQLADELKENGNKEITRNPHGWIKNHSLYKR